MDGFTEKKWFVYVGDHHEGPFSLDEIQGKISEGIVARENFAWCEGMTDWKGMPDIPEFESVLSGAGGGAALSMEAAPAMDSAPAMEAAPAMDAAMSLESAPPTEPSGSLSITEHMEATVMGAMPTAHEPAEIMMPSELSVPSSEPSHEAIAMASESSVAAAPPVLEERTGSLEKIDLVRNQALSMGPVQTRGGERFVPKLIKSLFALLAVTGVAGAYMQGYLDSALQHPAVQASVATLSDATRPYLAMVAEKVPFLSEWISPIPDLEGVSPEEYVELKAAAGGKVDAGSRAALALSKTDPLAPSFYIATNLPDGASFDVTVIGVPDTLLNQLGFTRQVQAVATKKLAKTAAVRFEDGKPLARGEYQIFATLSANQPPEVKPLTEKMVIAPARAVPDQLKTAKIVGARSYFLGGAKDAAYTTRLKEFHDKLRTKATSELAELKQFSNVLDSQLSSTLTKFSTLRKGRITPKQRGAWQQFSEKWMSFQGQLDAVSLKWTPDVLKKEYFHGSLYALVQQAAQSVSKVHGTHHGYFTGVQNPDPKAFEIQLGQSASGAHNAISILKSRIDQAEKLPPTPNGMPQRSGL